MVVTQCQQQILLETAIWEIISLWQDLTLSYQNLNIRRGPKTKTAKNVTIETLTVLWNLHGIYWSVKQIGNFQSKIKNVGIPKLHESASRRATTPPTKTDSSKVKPTWLRRMILRSLKSSLISSPDASALFLTCPKECHCQSRAKRLTMAVCSTHRRTNASSSLKSRALYHSRELLRIKKIWWSILRMCWKSRRQSALLVKLRKGKDNWETKIFRFWLNLFLDNRRNDNYVFKII